MADGKWVMTEEDSKRVDLTHRGSGLQNMRDLPNYGINKAVDDRDGKAALKCSLCGSDDLQSGFGGCGFGCVLMKSDVFLDVYGRFKEMFEPIGDNGEDVAFCWRARQCGYKIWCDPSVICGHVGYSVVDEKFFMAFQEQEVPNGTA